MADLKYLLRGAYGGATGLVANASGNPRWIMHAQLNLDVVTGAPPGAMWGQRAVEARATEERIGARALRSADLVSMEVDRLLEDVRRSLGCDMGAATRAAGRLAALLESRLPQDVRPVSSGLAPWQKRKVQSYIEDRLGEALRVSELAKLVSLSTTHFFRAFKESFGEPPHAYITRMKIAWVRTMMLTTTESLAQIALAGGFSDQAHLCKCFRQLTGTTPGAWRRSHATGA
jgi:transcriptional regulator GlxA family with amidase domain